MIKPVFEIGTKESAYAERQDCTLVIEVGVEYFYYVVLEAGKSIVDLKYYQFSVKNLSELAGHFEELVRQDASLQGKIPNPSIIYNSPESALVPGAYFDIGQSKNIIELQYGDLNTGVILNEKVESLDCYNVFRVPTEIHQFFKHYFPAGRQKHFYTLWMDCQQKEEKNLRDDVSVLFYKKNILVSVTRHGQCQLIQSLEYQTAEDVAYHLLNIFSRFNLHQEEIPLVISGMIDLNSAMYEALVRYFLKVETDVLQAGLTLPGELESFPPHFFSPLLKLAVCVS